MIDSSIGFVYILDISILVQSHFDLVFRRTLEATEPVTQMAVEMINIHLISVQQKR